MAKKKKGGRKINWGLIVLVIGLILAVAVVGQQTNWFNQAAGRPSDQALSNLNSTTAMLEAKNPDGSMGPQTSKGNWSNSLPSFLKGKLVFAVIDPAQDGKPVNPGSQGKRPTESFHQPNREQGSSSGKKGENGPQTVTALNLTITKVEVHMAYQGKPGDNKGQKGQDVDHWETLDITNPTTIDLVELAETKDVASLGLTSLAEGKYTEVRLYISSASATLTDESTVNLTILGKNNIVRVVKPFTVEADQTTTLTMDFDAQHSVIKAGDVYLLKPVVARLLSDHQTQ